MIYSLLFILAVSLGTFAQKVAPGPLTNEDEISYDILLGNLEHFLRHNVTGTKKCYTKVKGEYYNAIQDYGWDVKNIYDKGTLENLGKNKKEKEKIKNAIDVLKNDIGGKLYNEYEQQLGNHIQKLHFDKAVALMESHRENIRESLKQYKKIIDDLKKLNREIYNDIDGRLRGFLSDIMLSTGKISQKLTTCIKDEKCESATAKKK